MAYAIQRHRGQVATASGLDVLAGIWLLISPFAIGRASDAAMINNVTCGAVIAILALIRFFNPAGRAIWLSWLNAIIGAWLLFSPAILRFGSYRPLMHNNVVVGICVIILACWSGLAAATGQTDGALESRDQV
jgi:hypothetical protein